MKLIHTTNVALGILRLVTQCVLEVQKFQKMLKIIYTSNPNGVTESEKKSMAVDIHCTETKNMEYKYKKYDPCK